MRGAARPAPHGLPALRRARGTDLSRPRGLVELDDIDAVFGALSHETRRHVLLVLHARGGMTAGDLAARFECSWPTVTRHLQKLLDARLVAVERRGRERWYAIDPERLQSVTSLYLSAFE